MYLYKFNYPNLKNYGGIGMNWLFKFVLGLFFIISGLYSYIRWDFFRTELINFVKLFVGNLSLLIILIGFILILISLSEAKE